MIPTNFLEWKNCIEVNCGIPLTTSFVTKRIAELSDDNNHQTKEFEKLYGTTHRQKVIKWFEQSLQMQNALN